MEQIDLRMKQESERQKELDLRMRKMEMEHEEKMKRSDQEFQLKIMEMQRNMMSMFTTVLHNPTPSSTSQVRQTPRTQDVAMDDYPEGGFLRFLNDLS